MYARAGLGQTGTFSFTKVGASPTVYPAFTVGDTWTITITGPPSTPVFLGGSQNGTPFATYQLGTTDGSGVFTLSGVMGQADLRTWSEQWYVGGSLSGGTVYQGSMIANTTITVAAAAAPSTAIATTSAGATTSTSTTAPYVDPNLFNELITSQGLDIGSYDIPWWLVAAAVGGALFLFSGSKR